MRWFKNPRFFLRHFIPRHIFLSGSEERYRHEFQGYLAGLSLLTGVTENSEVLRCLHQCAESLQVPATSSLAPGMEMVTDNKGSRVIVDGPSQKDMATLVQQVIKEKEA